MDWRMRLAAITGVIALGAAVLLMMGTSALSQTDVALASRVQIKNETRVLEHAGKLTPPGEGSPRPASASTTGTTRSERKAETLQAARAGLLLPGGDSGDLKDNRSAAAASSTKSRDDRKIETLRAAKEHKLVPAGEASEGVRK